MEEEARGRAGSPKESPGVPSKPPVASGSEGFELPATFQAYLVELVGEPVRVSVLNAVDQAQTLMGRLLFVGRDYLLLQDPSAAGIPLGLRNRLAIPLSNVGGVDRLSPLQSLLPWLAVGEKPSSSS